MVAGFCAGCPGRFAEERPGASLPGSDTSTTADGVTDGLGQDEIRPTVEVAPLAGGVLRLDDETHRTFWSSPEDDVPESRVDNRHYVHTNEQRHHLFFPYMDCKGGGYLGVGSDQNYTMLARCRADFAWILDYDEIVVLLHAINRAFILESDTPLVFVEKWQPQSEQTSLAIIREHEADNPRLGEIEQVYTKYRRKLFEHFERLAGRKHKGKPSTWLADEGDYAYVRGMFEAGRIRPMMGNLLADRAVAGIGEASRALGIPVRVIYLTNVEELVHYNGAMRASFRSLPVDERSVVLRTLAYTNGYEIADNKWHYNIQSAKDFQERLSTKSIRVQVFMYSRKETGIKGVSTLGL